MHEKILVKNLKTKNFQVSINRTSIEVGKSQTSKIGKIPIDRIGIKYQSKNFKTDFD